MINKQIFEVPVAYISMVGRVAIGWGVHETVADECKKASIKKALITTTGLKGTGIVDEIKGILEHNGIAIEVFNKVTSNPKDHEVMAAYNVFKETKCDGIVSVGGGSSHDCGKGVRVVAAHDGRDIREFFLRRDWITEPLQYKAASIPQIAVNTTGGTSAECTPVAVITDTKTKVKQNIVVPSIAPAMGLVDPMLVRMMPPKLTAWTGWDAFMHSFEGYLSRQLIPEAAAIMLKGVQLIAENLREFTYNRMNHVACLNMCYAENMARLGYAAGATGAGAAILGAHGLGYPIGGITDCHHGLASAIVAGPAERLNEAALPDRFAEMAKVMGVDTRGMTKMQAADRCVDEVERLLADLNIKTGHLNEQVGLTEEDLKQIAAKMTSGITRTMVLGADEIFQFLKNLL